MNAVKSTCMKIRGVFVESPQIEIYEDKANRKGFESLYESERRTIEMVLPNVTSVIDIGCLNGDLFSALSEKKKISYTGVDFDTNAINLAKVRHPEANFLLGDFLDPTFTTDKADLVIAFNVFDHFENWRAALRNMARFSKRYINFSTLLRLDGGPSLVDPDLSFLYYGGAEKRLLWAVHNVWWLAAYAATEDVAARSIYVYCYRKYAERFNNLRYSEMSVHALPIENLYVGNVLIELGEPMRINKRRPSLTIAADGHVVFDSPWISGA